MARCIDDDQQCEKYSQRTDVFVELAEGCSEARISIPYLIQTVCNTIMTRVDIYRRLHDAYYVGDYLKAVRHILKRIKVRIMFQSRSHCLRCGQEIDYGDDWIPSDMSIVGREKYSRRDQLFVLFTNFFNAAYSPSTEGVNCRPDSTYDLIDAMETALREVVARAFQWAIPDADPSIAYLAPAEFVLIIDDTIHIE